MTDTKISHIAGNSNDIAGNSHVALQPTGDELGQPMSGIFEPPKGLLLGAIARNKLLVLACAITLGVVGLVFGASRRPTYTASTTLQVGTVNLNSPGFYGFVQAASSLATVFSRAITAEPVLAELKSKLGVGPSEAERRLSAEPIPISPSFRIVATGGTSQSAIRLANTASAAVITDEEHAAKETSPQAQALLKEYNKTTEGLERDDATVEQLQAEQANSRSLALKEGRTPDSVPSAALVKARIAQTEAHAQAEAINSSYKSVTMTNSGANPDSGLVSLVSGAATATSDHSSKIKLYGLVGLLIGLIVGCALAAGREWRRSAQLSTESGEAQSTEPSESRLRTSERLT